MLSAQAVAVTAEPDGRSAPEVSLDARVRRCRVGTTGNPGQFRRQTGLIVPFGDGHQGYSTPKSTSASYLSGECRTRLSLGLNACLSHGWRCGLEVLVRDDCQDANPEQIKTSGVTSDGKNVDH